MSDTAFCERKLRKIKDELICLFNENGMLENVNVDSILDDDMIESGLIDSMGAVCLQDQIKTYFNITIDLDQFIGECHTLNKLIQYLSVNEQNLLAL